MQKHRGIFVGGRARALLSAIANFKGGSVGRGREGRGLNLRINNERGVTRQEVGTPLGRAHALNTGVWAGGSFIMEREGHRPLSPNTTTPPSTPSQPLGRGFPLPSPPTSPPPLKIILHPQDAESDESGVFPPNTPQFFLSKYLLKLIHKK